jgi:hypothetical protein
MAGIAWAPRPRPVPALVGNRAPVSSFPSPSWGVISGDRTGLAPLTELGAGTYQGQTGGLYGNGQNLPGGHLAQAAAAATARVQPLDTRGRPSPNGRIGVISIGQSLTEQVFGGAIQASARVPGRNPAVTLVNTAQTGMILQSWAGTSQPWSVLGSRLGAARLSSQQVQVAWVEAAQMGAGNYPDLASRTSAFAADMARIVARLQRSFPNLQLVFISSRYYNGHGPGGSNPEPYAYESAFGVRETIRRFDAADTDISRGPVALWGPYQWADGTDPRDADGLAWYRSDFGADGVHLTGSGIAKAGQNWVRFFASSPYTTPWFLARPVV